MSEQNELIKAMIDAAKRSAAARSPEQAGESLYNMLNQRPEGESVGDGLPPVPHPPSYRPYPEVIGNHDLRTNVDELLRFAPELQGRVKRISHAPNSGVIREMSESGINPINFEHTNLLGLTSHGGGQEIFINPRAPDQKGTLWHEATHAVGGDETDARLSQALLERYKPTPDPFELLVKGLRDAGIQFKVEGE